MKIPKCKGARDLMPEDMRLFRLIEEVFRTSCTSWGYKEIRTPVLEYLHLFTSAGTLSPEKLSRVYSFLDWDGWSGERVVLRPDGTIPAARLYVENLSEKPTARLFYTENMFSFEETGEKSRERWQCGAELIGGGAPRGDAELIMLVLEIMEKLYISHINVKLSHVGLSKALLQNLGIPADQQAERLHQVLTGDISVLDELAEQPPEVKKFLNLLRNLKGKSLGFLANLKSILPQSLASISPYMDDLAQIAELLDSIGQDYQIDFTSGEGFEYYTGIVFQFYGYDKLLANGGRYDELVPLVGGDNIPASGFALFIDNIIPLLITDIPIAREKILLTSQPSRTEGMKDVFNIASLLRQHQYVVELESGSGDTAEYRWIISLEKSGSEILLTLIDKVSGEEQRGLSVNEVISHLQV